MYTGAPTGLYPKTVRVSLLRSLEYSLDPGNWSERPLLASHPDHWYTYPTYREVGGVVGYRLGLPIG